MNFTHYPNDLKQKLEEVRDEMNTPGICSSCIFLYDEGMLTCCIKNNRWKNVGYKDKCDINSWDGGLTF